MLRFSLVVDGDPKLNDRLARGEIGRRLDPARRLGEIVAPPATSVAPGV
jgi:hypothetical protein